MGIWGIVSWSSGWSADAITTHVIPEENGLRVEIQVDLTQLRYDPANGGALTLPGCEISRVPGRWALPMKRLETALPPGMTWGPATVHPDVRMFPARPEWALARVPIASESGCEAIHAGQPLPTLYPEAAVSIESIHVGHGVSTAALVIAPVQYRPATGGFEVLSRATLRLTWRPGGINAARPAPNHPEATRARDRNFARVLNAEQAKGWESVWSPARAAALSGGSPAYLPLNPIGTLEGVLLCPEAWQTWYRPMVDAKVRSGHAWDLVTYEWIDGQAAYAGGKYGDRAEKIRNFLKEAYQTYGLESVFFGGPDGPPYLPGVWDRRGHGVTQLGPYAHHSFGYYTNLDGDHDLLRVQGWSRVVYVTLQDPAVGPPLFREVWTPIEETVEGLPRCGYLPYKGPDTPFIWLRDTLAQAGITVNFPVGTTLSALFGGGGWSESFALDPRKSRAQAVAESRPDLWGTEVLFGAEGRMIDASTCDQHPELVAGWLPPDPQLGGVGLGFYLAKVERYLREGGVAQVSGNTHCSQPLDPVVWYRLTQPVGRAEMDQGLHSMSVLAAVLCHRTWWEGNWRNSYFTPPVLHPDGGPVVTVFDGISVSPYGGFHSGPGGWADNIPPYLPLGRLGQMTTGRYPNIPPESTWQSFHQAMVMGDPSLPQRTSFLSLVVQAPATAQETIPLTLSSADGSPAVGIKITASKRRPDGTYAYYQQAVTNETGVASFTPGALGALGSGVIRFEAGMYDLDFPWKPVRIVLPLPGNTPPVIVPNLPSVLPLAGPNGNWVILDAGASYDPDGDEADVTWTWTDYRTGVPVERERTGRYVRAFLPVGTASIVVQAGDGSAMTAQAVQIEVVDRGVRVTLPAVATPTFPVTVRNEEGAPLPGAVVQVTKRQLDGSFPVALTLTTDALGEAHVTLPVPPLELGKGALTVRVHSSAGSWRGAIPLPAGNTAPGVTYSLTTPYLYDHYVSAFGHTPLRDHRFPVTSGHQGVFSDIGTPRIIAQVVDPDGDEFWGHWQYRQANALLGYGGTVAVQRDILSGVSIQQDCSSWVGSNSVTLMVTDGVANCTTAIPLTGVRGLDYAPPGRYRTVSVVVPVWGLIEWTILDRNPLALTLTPTGSWVRLALEHGASDIPHAYTGEGPLPPGIASWGVKRITANAPLEFETSRILDASTVEVLAVPNPDGSLREYLVEMTLVDYSGTVGEVATLLRLTDITTPSLMARAALAVATTGGWVPVPLRVVPPGAPTLAGALEWTGWDTDPLIPSYIGSLPSLEVLGISSNDPNVPAPPVYRVEGTTLWVQASLNSDATLRRIVVTLAAADAAGHWSEAKENTVIIGPAGKFAFKGRVTRFVEDPTQVKSLEDDALAYATVELRHLASGAVVRVMTDFQGFWRVNGPYGSYHLRLGAPGQTESFNVWDPASNRYVTTFAPAGLTLESRVMTDGLFPLPTVSQGWATNTSPMAAVTGTLTVSTSGSTAPITLDGRASSDPDQDLLIYTWTWTDLVGHPYRQVGPVVTAEFPRGTTTVTLTVSDGTASASAVCQVRVQAAPRPGGGE